MFSNLTDRRWQLASTALAVSLAAHAFGTGTAISAEASVAAGGDTAEVKEVIVTATRTSQVLSKVPVSVSAFTQETMDKQGIKSFSEIARYTPGVTFDDSTKDVAIRGIQSNAGDATTGIYIDDTPIQLRTLGFNSNNTLPAVFDLDRVEVLRGPQGTLFGAGSEGGTVRYITPQPSLTTFSAYGRAETAYTTGGAPSAEAGIAVGGPLVQDKLGFRISLYDRQDGGYVDRIDTLTGKTTKTNSNWTDTLSWRAALAWAPTERLLITPTLQFQSRNQRDTNNYWESLSSPPHGTLGLSPGRFNNGNPERQSDYDRFYLASIKMEYDLGKARIISNTSGFSRREYLLNGYEGTLFNLAFFGSFVSAGVDPQGLPCTGGVCGGGTLTGNPSPLLTANGLNLPGFGRYRSPNSITNVQQNFTQELRIQSTDPDAKINWVVGVFYSKDRQESIEEIHDPQLAALTQYLFGETIGDAWTEPSLLRNGDDYYNRNVGHSSQTAVFADVTYNVTEKLKLIAGLRYARTHFDIANNADGPQNYAPSSGANGKNDKPFTPKISVSYQVTDNDMAYATVAKGYRIGGANVPLGAGLLGSCQTDLALRHLTNTPATYNSDSTVSYEVGSKNKLFNRSLQIATSVYHVDWSNIQYQDLLATCGIQYTTNLGSVSSNGFDFQGTWVLNRNVELDLAVGYTSAKFTRTAGPPAPGLPTVRKGDTIGGPPLTITIGGRWDFMLADRPVYLRVDDQYASQNTGTTPILDPQTSAYDETLKKPPATNYLSARIGTRLGDWDVSVFGTNLTNSHPELTRIHATAAAPIFQLTTERPLTVGVTGVFRY
jgi:iron complex outermembrane recepter protein